MKLLPLLAALPLLCASVVSANTLMSVGYFNGGGDKRNPSAVYSVGAGDH